MSKDNAIAKTRKFFQKNPAARVIDDKRHYSGRAVFRRKRHEGKAVRHLAVDDVALRATWTLFPLLRQDMEVIAAVGSRCAVFDGGGAGDGRCHQRPNGAQRFARCRFPVKTVVLPVITQNLLRISISLGVVLLLLRRHEFLANANRRQFIPPDSPEQNLLFARLRIEIPGVAYLDERDRRGPILRADVQGGGSIRLRHQPMHFQIPLDEVGAALRVLRFVARRDDTLCVRSEDIEHRLLVVALHRGNQGVARRFRR